MNEPQIEPTPDFEEDIELLKEEDEPSFGAVDWDDPNQEDGTAYVQRMNPPAPGQTAWQPTNAFLLICNVGPTGIGDETSHIINAGTTVERKPDAFMVSSVAGSSQAYDGSATALDGMRGFKVWFYIPSSQSWIIKEWTPTTPTAIGKINLKHEFSQRGGDKILVTSVLNTDEQQPTTIAGSTVNGTQVAPQAPAYESNVTING